MEHEGTKRHLLLQEKFNIILINVTMEIYPDLADLRVKVYNDLSGIEISHEEDICNWKYKERVYGRR